MIIKTTSYKSIQQKIDQDFGLQSNNWKDSSVEWMGDALGQIGCHAGYKNYFITLKVRNHKVEIPCFLTEIHLVEYRGIPLRFNNGQRKGNFRPLFYSSNYFGTTFSYVNLVTGETKEIKNEGKFVYIENEYCDIISDYITTSFEEGEINVYGIGYNLDEELLPRIPDSPYIREALAFFILYKWLGRGNKHITWDVKSAYDMWIRYRFKAQNEAIFPTIQEMDAFANMWNRIVPDRSAPNSFFMYSQNQQQIANI